MARGDMETSLWLKSSHLAKLMKMPSDGPRSSIMERARGTACLGPESTPVEILKLLSKLV